MRSLTVKYILLLTAQIILWDFFNLTQFLTIVFLPAMILCLPVRRSQNSDMLIAFVTGFIADFLCGGQLGLTSLALVPVAFARRYIIMLVFGSELYSRGEDISFHHHGWGKILISIIMLTALFLLILIAADSAGTRPLWIDLVKFAASLLVSSPVSLYIAGILCSETDAKWK